MSLKFVEPALRRTGRRRARNLQVLPRLDRFIRRRPFHDGDVLPVVRRERRADDPPACGQIGRHARQRERKSPSGNTTLSTTRSPNGALLYQFKAGPDLNKTAPPR